MATYRENLETRRSVVAAKLATLDADDAAGSKPSVKMSDGGTHIDHVEYRLSLYKELEAIQKLIDDYDQSGGPSVADGGTIDGLEVVSYVES